MTATTEKFLNASIPSASISIADANIHLKDIVRTLPRECFQKDPRKAWSSVLFSILAVGFGLVGIAVSPWFLLPFAWLFAGTAFTGLFVLAHDCGHRSFAKRHWVNDCVGQSLMLLLMFPFHSWRILHNHHHIHTNKFLVDNAWHAWDLEAYVAANPLVKKVYQALRGRFWWLASIVHWAGMHFDFAQFSGRDRNKVKGSIAAVIIFAAVFFPTLVWTNGIWGVVKFWLLPWLVYHFWMSTFTLVHHTTSSVQFRPAETWSAAEAQLAGTIHCTYPRWIEILCHDINVHVPHHVSVAIPAYNLRIAHQSLTQNWSSYIQERNFSWSMMQEIIDRCHLYHPKEAYRSFTDFKL